MQRDLPMLLPLIVPWQVSPSVPCLRLLACGEGAGDTYVEFIAHFGLDDRQAAALPSTSIEVISPTLGPFKKAIDQEQHSHRLVRVKCEMTLAARMLPAVADSVVFDATGFDVSAVHGGEVHIKDPVAWLDRFHKAWVASGNCPDPGVYEVKNSRWISELGRPAEHWRHLLIEGHDTYVEVVARDWTWEKGQPA